MKTTKLIQISTKDKNRMAVTCSLYRIVAVRNINMGEVYWKIPTVTMALLFTPHANVMSGTAVTTPVPISRNVVHASYGKCAAPEYCRQMSQYSANGIMNDISIVKPTRDSTVESFFKRP